MSRYGVEVERNGWTDRDADIGYDPMLGTYFLQAFREGPDGYPTVWLAWRLNSFLAWPPCSLPRLSAIV